MIIRILKYLFISFGCFSLILFILCFTSVPFWTWYRLSTSKAGIHRPPECIIVLGGGGMPGESDLMRTWYAAKLAGYFQHAKVIVSLPGDTGDRFSSVNLMKKELIIRGVFQGRILLENAGTNTRSEALMIGKMIQKDRAIAIVTSPEHLCRASMTFKKAGFSRIDGLPAFENAIESDITFIDRQLGGRSWLPNLGNNLTVRYKFWTQLHYEEITMRELFAISYYWAKGWI